MRKLFQVLAAAALALSISAGGCAKEKTAPATPTCEGSGCGNGEENRTEAPPEIVHGDDRSTWTMRRGQ